MKTMKISKLTKRLRNQPVTAVRLIRAVKYIFAEHVTVPRTVESRQVSAIQRDILKPLLGTAERKEVSISKHFIKNLLHSMAGLRVHELHPWLLSSVYTFAYFIISRREKNKICMEAFNCLLNGETPTSEAVRHVINDIILNCGNVISADNNTPKALETREISNFRKTLQRSCCKNELQVLAAWAEGLGLLYSTVELCNKENEMCHYFKTFEINASIVYRLNDSENKNTEECIIIKTILRPESNANIHNKEKTTREIQNKIDFKNLGVIDQKGLKDNSKKVIIRENIKKDDRTNCRDVIPLEEKTIKKPTLLSALDRLLEINCSSNDASSVSKNENKKLNGFPPEINLGANRYGSLNKNCNRQAAKAKADYLTNDSDTKLVSFKNSLLSNVSNRLNSCDNEVSCSRIQPFVGKTLRKPLYGDCEKQTEINSINEENDIVVLVTDSTDTENNSIIVNKNGTPQMNLIVSNKNFNSKLKFASHDVKEKADVLSNDIKIVSSKIVHKKSSYSSNVNKSLNSSNYDKNLKLVSLPEALCNSKADISTKDPSKKEFSSYNELNNICHNLNVPCSSSIPSKKEVLKNSRSPKIKSNSKAPNSMSDVRKSKFYITSKKAKLSNMSETCTDSINSTIQFKALTNSVTSNEHDEVREKSSNKIQKISVNENKIAETITGDTFNKKNTSIFNKNGTPKMNLNASNKISSRNTELTFQGAKKHIAVLSNNIDKNLISSKSTNGKSSSSICAKKLKNLKRVSVKPKRNSRKTKSYLTYIRECFSNLKYTKMNAHLKKNSVANKESTNIVTPKSVTPSTEICEEQSENHSMVNQFSPIPANENTLQANHFTVQPQDSQIRKEIFHNSKPNIVMNTPISVATARDSTLKKTSITVVDLDLEPFILNLENTNQQPQKIPIKKKNLDSSSKNVIIDSPISGATARCNFIVHDENSDTTSKTASVTAVDLDLETCLVNSKTTNQQPQEFSTVKKKCLDSRSNNPIMNSSIPVATAKDSTSEKTSVTVVDLDLEPSILILENTNQQQEKLPIKRKFVDILGATARGNSIANVENSTSVTVVDSDLETRMLNSKTTNQQSKEHFIEEKICLDSRSDNCVMDSSIPVTIAKDFPSNKASITLVDLDLEPSILISKNTNQQQEKLPIKRKFVDILGAAARDDFIANVENSASVTVVDSDLETRMLNSKTTNQQSKEHSIEEKKCLDSRSDNCVMDSSIPVTIAKDFPSNKASITLVDLDLETSILISENTNQQQEKLPIKKKFVDSCNNNFTKDSPVQRNPGTTAGHNFIANDENSAFSDTSEVNQVNPTNQPHMQQYPLQYQQQPCYLASYHDTDKHTLFSNENNGTPKYQSDNHQSYQDGSLSSYLSSSSSTFSNGLNTIQLPERNRVLSALQENVLWPILSTNVLTNDEFPLNQAAHKCSNVCKVKPQEITEVRISPLQQSNFQLNEKRYSSHCNDVQNTSLADITPTLCNCLQSQQQKQSMRYVFNNSTANSMAAVTTHTANDHLTPAPNVWQAPVTSDKFSYVCDYCPIHLKFESAKLFYKHMNDTHNHSCIFCNHRYPTFQDLLQHIGEHTRNISKEQEIAVHNELCRLQLKYALMFKSK